MKSNFCIIGVVYKACLPWSFSSTSRFACGQIPESINIPYNQAFLEEGGLAPSAAANTLNSFKGRVIIVVGSRANYPAKVSYDLILVISTSYLTVWWKHPTQYGSQSEANDSVVLGKKTIAPDRINPTIAQLLTCAGPGVWGLFEAEPLKWAQLICAIRI